MLIAHETPMRWRRRWRTRCRGRWPSRRCRGRRRRRSAARAPCRPAGSTRGRPSRSGSPGPRLRWDRSHRTVTVQVRTVNNRSISNSKVRNSIDLSNCGLIATLLHCTQQKNFDQSNNFDLSNFFPVTDDMLRSTFHCYTHSRASGSA